MPVVARSTALALALALGAGLGRVAHADEPPRFRSHISIFSLQDRRVTTLFTADDVWEAPNWSPDGETLLVNSHARLYRLALEGPHAGQPRPVRLDPSLQCNNDKGLSPNGQLLAFSAGVGTAGQSFVFIAAADGSHVRKIDPVSPSYFHGWSPDGRFVVLVAKRANHFNIYRLSSAGGPEIPLTSTAADDDGPDYAPSGDWIYFNSNRGGHWHIWRMPKDGAGEDDNLAEQLTDDRGEDWFPHPSPDGKHVLFLTFPDGVITHNDRMADMRIRMITPPSTKRSMPAVETLITLSAGQGTINVNSWAPDSLRFAFVSYEPAP
jgi:Tol biopolymer transport system component